MYWVLNFGISILMNRVNCHEQESLRVTIPVVCTLEDPHSRVHHPHLWNTWVGTQIWWGVSLCGVSHFSKSVEQRLHGLDTSGWDWPPVESCILPAQRRLWFSILFKWRLLHPGLPWEFLLQAQTYILKRGELRLRAANFCNWQVLEISWQKSTRTLESVWTETTEATLQIASILNNTASQIADCSSSQILTNTCRSMLLLLQNIAWELWSGYK